MTPPWMSESVGFCIRFVGRAIAGSVSATRAAMVAGLSLAETLLRLVGTGLADDLGQIKDSLIRREKAKSDQEEAEAKKRLAEAAEAANHATLHRRKDRFAQLELEKKQLENAKTAAEIRAIESDAAARRIQAVAEAEAKLIDAISKVRQDGGAVFFDTENLRRILDSPLKGLPPSDTSGQEPDQE